jgi:hypothetical protein
LLPKILIQFNSIQQFIDALDASNIQEVYHIGGLIVSEYYSPDDFESKIQSLIRLCDGALRYTFTPNEIQSARATRSTSTKYADPLSAEILTFKSSHATFKCPISYDNETDPALMICLPSQPLLVGIDKNIVDQIIDCPLNALNNLKFIDLLIQHLDHPISLSSLREAEAAGFPIVNSPITRRDLIGFVPLGCHKSHSDSADWSISQLITGGKSLGNKDFWFAVFWILIEDDKIAYLTEMKPFFREQMIWRLKNKTSTASLTGLSGFVQTKLRLDASIYFSLVSSKFTIPPSQQFDTLRLHIPHVNYLIKLMDLIGISIPDDIKILAKRTRMMFQLLSYSKKHGQIELLSLGNALIQNCFKINRDHVDVKLLENPKLNLLFVPLDGPASKSQIEEVLSLLPSACCSLSIQEIYYFIQLANPQKSAVDIQIPIDLEIPSLPQFKIYWQHYQGKFEELKNVQICSTTFRPFYRLSNGKTWRDAFAEIVQTNTKQILSVHRWFMDFCVKYNHLPSIHEFMLFSFSKVMNQQIETLCDFYPRWFKIIKHDFNKIIQGKLEFAIKSFLKSNEIVVREQVEKQGSESESGSTSTILNQNELINFLEERGIHHCICEIVIE